MFNNIDIYKKIINFKNLTDIEYLFSNIEYLDNFYNKFNNLYNTQKDVLVEENYYPENFKILELLLVKEKHSVFYEMWKYFYEPTIIKTYSNMIAVRVSSDETVPYMVQIQNVYLDSVNGNYTVIEIDEINSQITLDGDILLEEGLTDLTTNFKITQFGYDWYGTKIEIVDDTSIITLEDFRISGYLYSKETTLELQYRIKSTAEIRKSFLAVLEKEIVSKGTIDFMEFVIKFFYLIKYYDTADTLENNIQSAISISDNCIQEIGTNFVYTINSPEISKAEWETYIKPIVHPHGWICFFIEQPAIVNDIASLGINLLKNNITITDVLKPKTDIVLYDLNNIKRYGNIKIDHTIYNREIYSCFFNICGKYEIKKFEYYGVTSNLEIYDIKVPIISCDNITSTKLTVVALDYETDNKYGTPKTYYSTSINSFLNRETTQLPGGTLWISPTVPKEISCPVGSKLYFQSAIADGIVALAKSDITVIDRDDSYGELLQTSIIRPNIEPGIPIEEDEEEIL